MKKGKFLLFRIKLRSPPFARPEKMPLFMQKRSWDRPFKISERKGYRQFPSVLLIHIWY